MKFTSCWGLLAATIVHGYGDSSGEAQKQLQPNPDGHTFHETTTKNYIKREQSEEICKAGSRQWTGQVPVSSSKSLFYWFFESRHDPKNDPVIVWIDGGPGISSMAGLFQAHGPCLVDKSHPTTTTSNDYSWTNFANMVFIDQPAGVGFSSDSSESKISDPMTDGADDLNAFLLSFFTNIFPEYKDNDLHFAGNSYAGHFIPGYISHIMDRQKTGIPKTFDKEFKSIILFDGVLYYAATMYGSLYDHFCNHESPGSSSRISFNDTACLAMEEAMPECERYQAECLRTYDVEACRQSTEVCASRIGKWYDFYGPNQPDGDDDRRICDDTPACGYIDLTYADYLNLPSVQKALFRHEGVRFKFFNASVNGLWFNSGASHVPTTRQLSNILDNTEAAVLMVNGNNDILVDTTGQTRLMDNLPWRRQARFRSAQFASWRAETDDGNGSSGTCKAAGKLSFFAVNECGHMPMKDQREAVAALLKDWLAGPREEAFCGSFGI